MTNPAPPSGLGADSGAAKTPLAPDDPLADAPAKGAFDAERFIATLPARPGVYRMVGAEGEALYVGKARNLRARVASYFRAAGLAAKTLALTSRVRDVQVTVTGSETEALLLEQSLIKAERPRFNVVLRDDKSYPYIHLTDHPYPRLTFHRGAKKAGRYFGPYPSASAVRDSLNILQKLFGVRPCADGFFKNRSRPCLQYQIKRCSGPCVGLVDRDQYAEDVRGAVMFLEGKSGDLLEEFKTRMAAAAERLAFERAARYRDQIGHLRRIQESQYVHGEGGDADIFGIALGSGRACVQGLFVRGGRLLGHRTWYPNNQLGAAAGDVLFAFLSQYYLSGNEREVPRTVVAAEPHDDQPLLADALKQRSGRKTEVACQVRGQRARWAAMATENAELSLAALLADKADMVTRLIALQAALGLEDQPQRLECFDISHAAGEATVASCVVFDAGGPLKSDYRRFNIEGVPRGDDYGAIEQAIRRRYTRLAKGEGPLPDALIIDGGSGQVARAAEVLEQLQVENVALLGIAKGLGRKPGLETVILAGHGELALPPGSAAMHLLQHIRDEAHRFAVAGHRGRRAKQRRQSVLDGVPGVGARRKRDLLAHFGSVAAIQGASVEEIAKVRGFSSRLAGDVYATLHG